MKTKKSYQNIIKIMFVVFAMIFFANNHCFANENLSFVYINGSNNNDEKMRNWYIEGVTNLHPILKKRFEKDATLQKWTKDNKLTINKDPQIFFWGYDSKTDLEYVQERLDFSRAHSSVLAYEVRSLITQVLHDAIWVQKDHNMLPILDELNDQIKELANADQNVILYGYSAGSFVTHQYMLYKLQYINTYKLFETLKVDKDILDFVRNNPRENTCLSALTYGKGNIGVLANTGHFVLNQDKEQLKQNYLKLNSLTEEYCAPKGRIRGVVNFASPIPLFYSDLADENYQINFYNKHTLKYVMENGIYFLTINFGEDPLGFPTSKNLTIPQMEQALGTEFENPTGVIFNNSRVWGKRWTAFAHTSYWSAKNTFSKAVIQSFVTGTKFLYDEKFQQQAIKKKKV